eukprot:13324333-Alexandrium_andersonii.AAC.1
MRHHTRVAGLQWARARVRTATNNDHEVLRHPAQRCLGGHGLRRRHRRSRPQGLGGGAAARAEDLPRARAG